MIFIFDWVGNIAGKEENDGNQQRFLSEGCQNSGLCGKELKVWQE